MSDSEDDLSSLSESSSANSTPQSEGKGPLSPRDFWREKTGKSTVLKRECLRRVSICHAEAFK